MAREDTIPANVHFGFNNAVMLRLLKQRGEALTYADFKTVASIEAKMTKKKDKYFEDICRPCYMILTFNNQDAFINLTKQPELEIMEEKLNFEQALMPQNMNWENREVKESKRLRRMALAIFFIVICGNIYYILASMGMTLNMFYGMMKAPPGINCHDYDTIKDPRVFQTIAVTEYRSMTDQWVDHYNNPATVAPNLNSLVPRDGMYQCYCENVENGEIRGVTYDTSMTIHYQDNDGNPESWTGRPCLFYHNTVATFSFGTFVVQAWAQIVVVGAMGLRYLLIFLATKIRFFSVSREVSFVMISIFYMTVFQYCIVPLLAPADLRASQNPIY